MKSPPELTVTMLGPTGSGKSVFLLGMYATLATGIRNYFIFTEEPDDGVDLNDAWDLLVDRGELPPATGVDQNPTYKFAFNYGFIPLLSVDWMDYRGGALDDRADTAQDVVVLRERLRRSDSIYLVLDAEQLLPWVSDPGKRTAVQRALKVGAMSSRVQEAVRYRQQEGLPVPSLVVVITKTDQLREEGRSASQALASILEGLQKLLPVAFAPGVTAFVCPVQVGHFAEAHNGLVDASTVDPVSLHRPLIFSLMHYLSEGLGARQAEVARMSTDRSAAEAQLVGLQDGFRAMLRRRRAADLKKLASDYAESAEMAQQLMKEDEGLISQLDKELEGHPTIRDGVLTL